MDTTLTVTPDICPHCNKKEDVISYTHQIIPIGDFLSTKRFHCNKCDKDFGFLPLFKDVEAFDKYMKEHPWVDEWAKYEENCKKKQEAEKERISKLPFLKRLKEKIFPTNVY